LAEVYWIFMPVFVLMAVLGIGIMAFIMRASSAWLAVKMGRPVLSPVPWLIIVAIFCAMGLLDKLLNADWSSAALGETAIAAFRSWLAGQAWLVALAAGLAYLSRYRAMRCVTRTESEPQ
jgi:hypothetical protein